MYNTCYFTPLDQTMSCIVISHSGLELFTLNVFFRQWAPAGLFTVCVMHLSVVLSVSVLSLLVRSHVVNEFCTSDQQNNGLRWWSGSHELDFMKIKGARLGIILFQDEVIHWQISRCLHSIYHYHPQTHLVEMPGERMKSFESDPEEQNPRMLALHMLVPSVISAS